MYYQPIHSKSLMGFAGGESVPVELGNHFFASSTCIISWVTRGADDVTFCRRCRFFTIKQPPGEGSPEKTHFLVRNCSLYGSCRCWLWRQRACQPQPNGGGASYSKRQLRKTCGNTPWPVPVNERTRRSEWKHKAGTWVRNLSKCKGHVRCHSGQGRCWRICKGKSPKLSLSLVAQQML